MHVQLNVQKLLKMNFAKEILTLENKVETDDATHIIYLVNKICCLTWKKLNERAKKYGKAFLKRYETERHDRILYPKTDFCIDNHYVTRNDSEKSSDFISLNFISEEFLFQWRQLIKSLKDVFPVTTCDGPNHLFSNPIFWCSLVTESNNKVYLEKWQKAKIVMCELESFGFCCLCKRNSVESAKHPLFSNEDGDLMLFPNWETIVSKSSVSKLQSSLCSSSFFELSLKDTEMNYVTKALKLINENEAIFMEKLNKLEKNQKKDVMIESVLAFDS